MDKSKINKTNALRLLDTLNIDYDVLTYPELTNGVEVAKYLNLDVNQVFKTLVTVNKDKEHFVFMIPVQETLDLKKGSSVTNSKYIEMIPQKELLPLTGYIHGGCSPLGMKKKFATYIDESVILYEDVYFSAGKIGMQVKMKTKDLLDIIKVIPADLIK